MVTVTVRSFFHGSGYGSAEPKIVGSVVHYKEGLISTIGSCFTCLSIKIKVQITYFGMIDDTASVR